MASQHEQALADRFLNKRVKRSWRTIRVLWWRWQHCSNKAQKERLGVEYRDLISHRGTVVAIVEEDLNAGIAMGMTVKWDSGLESKCMAYELAIIE